MAILRVNRNLVLSLVLIATIVSSLSAQVEKDIRAINKPTSSWVLDDFDDHTKSSNVTLYNGGLHDVEWNLFASRYITRTDEKPYPQKAYIPGVSSLIPHEYKREPEAMRLFGIRAAFNTKGVNTIDMVPTDKNNTLFLDEAGNPLEGVFFTEPVNLLGIYALGLLRNYDVTATFETSQGKSFTVLLGNLNYKGWKALSANLPVDKYVNEETFINNRFVFKLNKISIVTRPLERVDDFVAYFDQIYYTKPAVNDRYYDGYELTLPDFKFGNNGESGITWEEGSTDTQ